MAFFADNFTGSDGTLLDAHTPDTGASWTRLWGTTNTNAEINTNRCRSDGDLNSGVIYTADATYPSADYDITFTDVSLVNQSNRPVFAFVRIQDQENMYAVYLSKATNACRLYKKVSGTWTALGSAFDEPADGSVCKLEIIGTALKFYDDGVEVASATDSDISAAGKAGIGFGGGAELVATTDDGSTSNIIDTLTVNDLGAGGTTYDQSVSGGITPSGAALKQGNKTVAGAITPSGATIKQANKITAGSITPTGILAKLISKFFSGGVTPTGALTSVRTFVVALAGTLTSAGTLVKETGKAIAGSLPSAGDLSKLISKFFAGGVTPTGALTSVRTFVIALAGTLTSAGTLVKETGKAIAGSLPSAGDLSKLISKFFAGGVTPTGALTTLRAFFVSLAGSLTSAGTLAKETGKSLAGTLTSSGTITRLIDKLLAGVLSLTGTISSEGGQEAANPIGRVVRMWMRARKSQIKRGE